MALYINCRHMSTQISNKVYNFIRQKLLSSELSPGDRISEFAIAKELKISRSPIREAISRLVSDGFVEKFPGLGAFVAMPDRREIEEYFVLREMLECYTVSQAAKIANDDELSELKRTCDVIHDAAVEIKAIGETNQELARKIIEADREFHILIMKITGNRPIIKIVENFRVLTLIFGLYSERQLDFEQVNMIWQEHTKIYEALKARDVQEAQKWMKLQIERSRNLALTRFDELMPNNNVVRYRDKFINCYRNV